MKKVLGMGNALVDVMTRLESDKLLEQFELPKGSMQLVEADVVKKIGKATEGLKKSLSSGGSAANTIHGLAHLSVDTGFIGKVGNDKLGNFFADDLKQSRIKPSLLRSNTPSGRAVALVSEDSERTFATYLGAAVELSPEDLDDELFKGYDYFHVEGYLVQSHELLTKAATIAQSNNMKISIDLASYNIVEMNLDFLDEFISDYVDILFANEEEARSLTGKEPEEALNILATKAGIAIVKIGSEGSLIKQGDQVYRIKPIEAQPVDTTGAGDVYASGFLYGLISNYDLETSGKIGSLLAGKVIEVTGAKMNMEKWNEIHNYLAENIVEKQYS
ncbi:MAG: adenosine kinase [Bacteroidales bacterium]|nr:adenosine kinase [Bacteroidales bacterium]